MFADTLSYDNNLKSEIYIPVSLKNYITFVFMLKENGVITEKFV